MIVAKIIKKLISKMFWAGKHTGKHLHSTKVAQWGKNWDPVFTFLSPVKNEHLGSMFVTCACPGL